jgi:hypothetical protein
VREGNDCPIAQSKGYSLPGPISTRVDVLVQHLFEAVEQSLARPLFQRVAFFQRSRGLHGRRPYIAPSDEGQAVLGAGFVFQANGGNRSPQIPDSPAGFLESWRGISIARY